MRTELIAKLEEILERDMLTEEDVSRIFNIARKLIEKLEDADKENYALLKFYCDWLAHEVVDKSQIGANIIETINTTYSEFTERGQLDVLQEATSAALGLKKVHEQLQNLIQQSGGSRVLEETSWNNVLPHLLEIISWCPLTIGEHRWLSQIKNRVRENTDTEGLYVHAIAVVKFPYKIFVPESKNEGASFVLILTLSNAAPVPVPIFFT